ncbi:hypothetical protein Dimus_003796 [Dionaea muscipula]
MDASLPSLSESEVFKIITKIMVGSVIVLLIVIIFVSLLQLYAKWYWSRDEDPNVVSMRRQRRRQRFVFAAGVDQSSTLVQQRGLDTSVLVSLPIVVYSSKEFKDGLECAVCLCDLAEGEEARLLPKCKHGFHVDCIDMWLQSHSTCPLCRNPVVCQSSSKSLGVEVVSVALSQSSSDDNSYRSAAHPGESPNFPTNVLFWGDETRVRSHPLPLEEGHGHGQAAASQTATVTVSSAVSSSNRLVIETPNLLCEQRSSSPSVFRLGEEEAKSPMTTRLGTLKRLLSRGKRPAPSTSRCSSSSGDVEQG